MAGFTDTLENLFQTAQAAVAGILSSTHFLFKVVDQPKGLFKVIHWQGNEAISTD